MSVAFRSAKERLFWFVFECRLSHCVGGIPVSNRLDRCCCRSQPKPELFSEVPNRWLWRTPKFEQEAQNTCTKNTKIPRPDFCDFCVRVFNLLVEKRPSENASRTPKTRTQKTQKYLAMIFVFFVYVFWASDWKHNHKGVLSMERKTTLYKRNTPSSNHPSSRNHANAGHISDGVAPLGQ